MFRFIFHFIVFLFSIDCANASENVALSKPIQATSNQSKASRLVDGDDTSNTSRWFSESSYPQSVAVDLQNRYSIDLIEYLQDVNRTDSYRIDIYDQGTLVHSFEDTNTSGDNISINIGGVVGDEVHFTVLAGSNYQKVFEFKVYGNPADSSGGGGTPDPDPDPEPTPDTTAPTAPSSLSPSQVESNGLILSWVASTDADSGMSHYQVYQDGVSLGTVTGTSTTISGLNPETTYSFSVEAVDLAGNISDSVSLDVTTLAAPVTSETTNVALGKPVVTSSNPEDAYKLVDGEEVLSSRWFSSSSYPQSISVDLQDTYSIQTVEYSQHSDRTDSYRVEVYNAGSLVTSIEGVNNSGHLISVSLGGVVGDEVQFHILAGSNYQKAYELRVLASEASSGGGDTGGGDPDPEPDPDPTPDTLPPSDPANLAVSNITATSLTLSWSASTDADSGVANYSIFRNGALFATTTNTSYAVSGLSPETTYSLGVEATDVAGNPSNRVLINATTANLPVGPGNDITFAQGLVVSTGPVTSVAAGDFNGDGFDDIAVVNGESPQLLAWYEGPSFTVKHNFNTSYTMLGFTGSAGAADIDGDGDIDFVFAEDNYGVSASKIGKITWMENPGPSVAGQQTWQAHSFRADIATDPSNFTHANDMKIADMDGDGKLDIVIRHRSSGQYTVAKIAFQDSPTSFYMKGITLGTGEGICLGDVDSDGRADIVLNGYWMSAPASPRTGTYTYHEFDSSFLVSEDVKCEVADIDQDGKLDIAIAVAENTAGKRSWFKQPADAFNDSWSETQLESGSTTKAHNMLIGDMDLDGKLDIVTGLAFNSEGIIVYQQLDSPYSFQRLDVNGDYSMYSGVLLDIDGDGDLDIAGPDGINGSLVVYENKVIP